jgi:alkylation response protein AidB-like acyl-CoA dehydrogenase
MALTAEQRDQQFKQAEDLLFSKEDQAKQHGFAKGLFFGYFNAPLVFPYPEMNPGEVERAETVLRRIQEFADQHIDAARIDREQTISRDVIDGLGKLGVLGMTVPTEFGGQGFSQFAYCKMLEIIGGADASLGIFVNAHHSIGLRALLLEGTPEQQKYWLPKMVDGGVIGAFALTEPEAGSDAGNVQTTATPTEDGQAYLINGHKRYISNAAWSGMMTLMARTPVPGKDTTEVTAFIVEPSWPGFEWIHKSQPKCGVRGTAQAEFKLHNVRVPKENILGKLGKGLRLALSVLNFGRTTFGATCTGAAKVCIKAAVKHANTRRQFQQTLGEFEMVKKKLAHMAADTFAMESATYHCASMIDRGYQDYMLETAMLKVFASDALWRIVNDCIQIHGGMAYFSDQPYERMMRDARINLIGEGANDVMRQFIAMYGLGSVGMVVEKATKSLSGLGSLLKFAGQRMAARFSLPDVPVKAAALKPYAAELAKRVSEFGKAVEGALLRHQKAILERQYVQERLADACIEMYMSTCVLSRLDLLSAQPSTPENQRAQEIGRFYLTAANRRIKMCLAAMEDNDDEETTKAANLVLGTFER